MDTLDLIHAKIHGLRMMAKYKPSQFELDVSKLICAEYKNDCDECREKLEELDLHKQLTNLKKKQGKGNADESSGFLGGIFK